MTSTPRSLHNLAPLLLRGFRWMEQGRQRNLYHRRVCRDAALALAHREIEPHRACCRGQAIARAVLADGEVAWIGHPR